MGGLADLICKRASTRTLRIPEKLLTSEPSLPMNQTKSMVTAAPLSLIAGDNSKLNCVYLSVLTFS